MLWSEATNEWIRIHDIIQFVNTFYGMSYAEHSRETFRKQPLHMQVKLLRVLQQKKVTRVGGTDPVKLDVRVIAATNRDMLFHYPLSKLQYEIYAKPVF